MTDANPPASGQEPRFDLALFEEMNRQYASKPLVPEPPRHDPTSLQRTASARLETLRRWVDIEGRRVLEVGAGRGHQAREMVDFAGAGEVLGLDIVEYPTWPEFGRDGVRLVAGDLTQDDGLVPARWADLVVSNSVLEHVTHPLAMIEAIARALRAGGEACLVFNLHRGPKASHRYREIYFPWPHLLFEPEVCREFYLRHQGRDTTFAWVNRLTLAEYMQAFRECGLKVLRLRRRVTPIDLGLYLRFEEVLGRYPALDLETDFAMVRLRKVEGRVPPQRESLGLAARQREFEAELALARG